MNSNLNNIFLQDLEYAVSVDFIDWNQFKKSKFFITGGTGLIGKTLVKVLLYANSKYNLDISLTLLVRSISKAKDKFRDYPEIQYIEGNIENIPQSTVNFDYVIHAASPTSSRFFAENPVETLETSALGIINLFQFIKNMDIKGFVYLSSMEVYGAPCDNVKITENHPAVINLSTPRDSYPVGKCFCESLCVSYAAEYGIPTRILRLTQTFGPGVKYNDQRVFAEFARCVIEGRDIILATKGETSRNYLYTIDAVTAIIALLIKGENGKAYNAANETTYCSIKEMAEFVASNFGNTISVRIDETTGKNRGFAPVLHMNLDTSKLKALGWHPNYSLDDMYYRMIISMKAGN